MRSFVMMIAALALAAQPQTSAARGRWHRAHGPKVDAFPNAEAPTPPERPGELTAEQQAAAQPQETPPPEEARMYVDAPLPPERPPEFSAQAEPPAPREALAYAAPIEPERPEAPFVAPPVSGSACLTQLKAAGVDFERAEQPHATLSGCHIDTPVRISSLPAGDRRVDLPANPLVDCAYALQFADFAARLAIPLGPRAMHASLVAFDTGPGYECRGRNRVAGARISAHGKGIALDVSGFVFEDGRKVVVAGQRDAGSRAYFTALRKGSCEWFTTVLGPGSDGYHEQHLHFDIEQHGRHNKHYCH